MNVVMRRKGEGVWLGENIHVTVLGSRKGQVRLGISAPAQVRVERDEQREQEAKTQDAVEAAT
jgi:carbon storage regulator